MTVDFQLAFPCPHLTVEERVTLGSDRRSLEVRQPINSGDFIQVLANSDLDLSIPSEGLLSQARIISSKAGPFTLCRNQNRITVSNSSDSVTVPLPLGTRVTTDQVVKVLQRAFLTEGAGVIAVNNNGHLTLSDISRNGPESRIRIAGDATASLNFLLNTGAKGKKLFPGWVFAERNDVFNTVNINQFVQVATRYIRFNQPVRSNPVFKVTYATLQQRCRRCRSFGIENDYRFDGTGEALLIGNENLLNQALLKILTTRKGSNPFHEFYGTTLLDRIGSKNSTAAVTSINEDVLFAVDTFKKLQAIQGRFQELTARERLFSVLSLRVTPAPRDPTVVQVEIVGTNASGQPVNVNTVFAAPGTAALVGSSGLSLGLEGFGVNPNTRREDVFGR